MRRILKYILTQQEYRRYIFPKGIRILSVKAQYGDIVLYGLVEDIDYGKIFIGEKYDIYIKGTGHMADDVLDFEFLGTVKLKEGSEMWHVFYKKVNNDEEVDS